MSTTSDCGESYVESIAATGHTWVLLRTVTTEYDEDGNLVQQGYSIYECSVCGEEYKDESETGPPGSSGNGSDSSDDEDSSFSVGELLSGLLSAVGSLLGGLIEGFITLLTKAVEALGSLGGLFSSLVEGVTGLFGGFTSFLTSVFPFLPSKFTTTLELGLILMIVAAVLRRFLKQGAFHV